MRFSLTDSIRKKIFVIISLALISTVILVITGIVAVKIANVCVLMNSGERDHTVNYYKAFSLLERFSKDGKDATFEEFRRHLKLAAAETKSFSLVYEDMKTYTVSEHLDDFEKSFPRFTREQCTELLLTTYALFWHPLVHDLVENTRKGYAVSQDILETAELYRTANESDKPALFAKLYDLNKEMNVECQDFSEGVRKLSAWAVGLLIWVLIILFILLFALVILFGLYFANSITRPIRSVVEFADVIANGDLSRRIQTISKDETALLTRAMNLICDRMGDNIGQAARASQMLAEGASQQAASIEQTSSSLEEMASMARQSADNAAEADNLMQNATRVVIDSNASMEKLTSSMEDITGASEETQKIVKTIDEIAFQTNLLALNAAVEAARAGEAGAGFAVVADEVRNLAMRSADAARNTAMLIDDTVNKISTGSGLVNTAASGFRDVTTGATKVGELLSEIAAASREQAQGVDQVNLAVGQMDKVVQQNAASAEELASGVSSFKTR